MRRLDKKLVNALEEEGKVSTLRDLLKAGANPNVKIEHATEEGIDLNPLIWLTRWSYMYQTPGDRQRRYEKLKSLLEAGALDNVRDKNGETALFGLCGTLDDESLELLLRFGSDVNAVNHKNETPLHQVIHYIEALAPSSGSGSQNGIIKPEHLRIMQSLLNAGARLDLKCDDSRTQRYFGSATENGTEAEFERTALEMAKVRKLQPFIDMIQAEIERRELSDMLNQKQGAGLGHSKPGIRL